MYKVTSGNNCFFLKILKWELIKEKIEKIAFIYEKLNIKSLHIIEIGYIKSCEKYYILYNFIEGQNLKIYNDEQNTDLKSIKEIGKTIGQQLLKLKKYGDTDAKNILGVYDIKNDIKNSIENFQLLMQDNNYRNMMLEYYTKLELKDMENKLIKYGNMLKRNNKPKLIHWDIKRSNIMVDKNKEFHFVDIESMKFSYDVINFKYQITWALFDGNESEFEFVKGCFDGIYNNKRPKNFNYYVIFVVILNFFTESYHQYRYDDVKDFKKYIKKCRAVFNKIKDIDLCNDNIV